VASNVTERGLRAALDPLRRRIAMAVSRAVVRLVNDGESRQRLQVEILKGELRDGVERAQDYGFTSHPLAGCDAVIVCGGGSREQAIAVVVDDRRYRIKLQPGEVAMYDDLGNCVKLLRDMVKIEAVQHLEAVAPTTKLVSEVTIDGSLTVNGPATVNGASQLNGNIASTGTITNNGKRIDSTHTHGGVTPGGGTTGVPS
jgi:phage baseplate assembly protein V